MRHLFSHLLLLAVAAHAFAGIEPPRASTETINLGLRGVYFVPNEGQWSDREVIYGLRSRGLDVAFRESAITMHLARQVGESAPTSRGKGSAPPRIDEVRGDAVLLDDAASQGDEDSAPAWEQLTLTVTFPGSSAVQPIGAQPQSAKFNYFVGGQGRNTAANVPSFGAVIYENLYDGIDLHVMGSDDGVLKYEFHCAPGADYGQIRIHYDGIDSLCIDDSGNLHIATKFGTLADASPIAWQAGDATDSVAARFELTDSATYRVALAGPIDPTRTIIIDPDVEWMTYLGGYAEDIGYGIAVDSAGNALLTGETSATDFEGRNNSYYGNRDAFALKVSPSGELLWMTYLGGSEDDRARAVIADSADNPLVTGWTYSTDFAGRTNSSHGSRDAFALKFDPSGQIQWMIYLGGDHDDAGWGIVVDSDDNALLTGETYSYDFEGRNNSQHGLYDAFALKVSPSGQLLWMTFLGGGPEDFGYGIAADSAGNALVTGSTRSTNFEGRNNSYHGDHYDAFALKVSASGQLLWMIYLGGSDVDFGYGIAVDSAGNALVAGSTDSLDFEGRNNSFFGGSSDAFALKIDPSGQLQWMTYLGGSGGEHARATAADSADNALVAGRTGSDDFKGGENSHHDPYTWDAFALTVSPSGQIEWMNFLGGRRADYGYGIALDAAGDALVGGSTVSSDFEGRNNAFHGYDQSDAFILKLRLTEGPQLTVNATCPSGGAIQLSWSGATPDGQVAILFARTTGSFIIPNNRPCPGTTLGLSSEQIQIAFQGSAGPDGSRTLNANAGPSACGGYLQLLDLTTCTTSNVVRIE